MKNVWHPRQRTFLYSGLVRMIAKIPMYFYRKDIYKLRYSNKLACQPQTNQRLSQTRPTLLTCLVIATGTPRRKHPWIPISCSHSIMLVNKSEDQRQSVEVSRSSITSAYKPTNGNGNLSSAKCVFRWRTSTSWRRLFCCVILGPCKLILNTYLFVKGE